MKARMKRKWSLSLDRQYARGVRNDRIFTLKYMLACLVTSQISVHAERKRMVARLLYPQTKSVDQALMHMEYRYDSGRELNLNEPKDLAAKLQWLKVNYHGPEHSHMADKYEVRSYVEKKVGDEVLTKCYGVFDNPDDISLSELPEKFVVKATHGCDMTLLCLDKNSLDWKREKERMREWLNTRIELVHGETHYSYIKARLIVEELLREEDIDDLSDYKFFCFNGEPRFFKIDRGRTTTRIQKYYYLDGRPAPFGVRHYETIDQSIPLPRGFLEMVMVVKKLSEDVPFARIDLYNIAGKIKFGEITLTPCGGNLWFEPREWSDKMGEMLILPSVRT